MKPPALPLAGAGLAVGAAVLGVVAALLRRTLRPAEEIRRYADDIRAAGDAIAANLEPTRELRRTSAAAGRLAEIVAGTHR